MSKSLKRHRVKDGDEYSDHKIKALKKRGVERKLARLKDWDYLHENDTKFYRTIKEYR